MRLEQADNDIAWAEVAALFHDVGWLERDPEELRAAFARSTFKVFACDGPVLVGIGRTVDDGRFYATIVDLVVARRWQRRGIGRAILEDLQSRLAGFMMVTLTASAPVQPFYRRMGWLPQTTAMLLPRSPQQAAANCLDSGSERWLRD
jgi:GNAT superfamily N-acetyltransferase